MKIDLKNILAEKFYELEFIDVSESIRDAVNYIIDSFRDDDFNKICEEYNSAIGLLSRVTDIEIQRESVDYLIGRYVGIMEMMGEALLKNTKQKKVNDFIGNLKIEDLPHFNDIIITVGENPKINHQKLADSVGITKGTLTPIMDKLVESGLITFMRPGKFKYYYLTPQGDKYYKDKLINIRRVKNKDALFEDLLLFVENSDNPSECVGKINSFLYNKKFKSDEFKEKNNKRLDPLDMLTQITIDQPVYISIDNTVNNFEADEIRTVTLFDGDQAKKHISFSNSKLKNMSDEDIFFDLDYYVKAN
jgi:DNA-binding PadR family transcriptional regulator